MGIEVIGATGGGATGGKDFTLTVGTSGNTTYPLSSEQPAGDYIITSALSDTTYDIYFVAANETNAGYTNTSFISATKPFTKVVIYGATTNDVIDFEFKSFGSPSSTGDVEGGAAPFLTSVSNTTLPLIDDTTTVTGGNFADDVEIDFIGADLVVRPAKNIIKSSSTELIVTRPDVLPPEQEPYTLVATNPGITSPSTNVHKLVDFVNSSAKIQYVVVAGGGGAGDYFGGAGGAGGYRSSVPGEISGANSSPESTLQLLTTTTYTVQIGAGGTAGSRNAGFTGGDGGASQFGSITTVGGGGGGGQSSGCQGGRSGGSGGSNGGSSGCNGGSGTAGQGTSGYSGSYSGAGGGAKYGGNSATNPGEGATTMITGTSKKLAFGSSAYGAVSGPNTGNGGVFGEGTPGHSGIVIFKYPASFTCTIGAGLTGTTATVGEDKVTQITAGTGTVSFA